MLYPPCMVPSSLIASTFVTAGDVAGTNTRGIDHIAVSGLAASRVWGWPNVLGGMRCSDHGGTAAELR